MALRCEGAACARLYPLVDNIPILINEPNSAFRLEDFVTRKDTTFDYANRNPWIKRMKKLLPTLYANYDSAERYSTLARMLEKRSGTRRILVIGGSILGLGMDALLDVPDVEWVDTDVAFGPRTKLICDAHDLPFADGTFDAAIAQAVLEHVADPYRCVAEIHRVLKPDGLAYAETPFLWPMHGGVYDFTRFTYMGHRRLFRFFTEIDSGASSGPGSTLALTFWYFLLSLARTRHSKRAASFASMMLCGALKYLDPWLVRNPSALDVAPGFFFMGYRSERAISDRTLVEHYRVKAPPRNKTFVKLPLKRRTLVYAIFLALAIATAATLIRGLRGNL